MEDEPRLAVQVHHVGISWLQREQRDRVQVSVQSGDDEDRGIHLVDGCSLRKEGGPRHQVVGPRTEQLPHLGLAPLTADKFGLRFRARRSESLYGGAG